MRVVLSAVAALVGALFVSAAPASADQIIYNFTNDYSTGNSLGCTSSASCGTATVTDISGGVSVALDIPSGGFWKAGDMNKDQLYFNLSVTPTSFSSLPSGWTATAGTFSANPVSGNTFDYKLDCNSTCGSSAGVYTTPFTFDINGITTADFICGTSPLCNGNSNYFLADLSITSGNSTNTGDAGATQTTDTRQVPEPTTLLLFGSGIAGIGAMRRRKSKAA